MQQISEILQHRMPVLRGLEFEPPKPIKQSEIFTLIDLDTSDKRVSDAVQWARKWQERHREHSEASYVLSSQGKGVGKTHILKAILWSKRIVPVGIDGVPSPANQFYMADDLINRLFGKEKAQARSLIPIKDSFVCIDDVGTESKPEYVGKDSWPRERQVAWFKVVNHCYENKIGLILTTNLKIGPELEDWIGSRSFSRLMEMAPKGFMRDLSGVADWRKKASGR